MKKYLGITMLSLLMSPNVMKFPPRENAGMGEVNLRNFAKALFILLKGFKRHITYFAKYPILACMHRTFSPLQQGIQAKNLCFIYIKKPAKLFNRGTILGFLNLFHGH